MKFAWDENKNAQNIRKHGIDFHDVPEVFKLPMLVLHDSRADYGEDRWIGLGLLRTVVIVVVYTELKNDVIRIISARKATKQERKMYEKRIEDEF